MSCAQLGYDGSTGRINADDADFVDQLHAQGITVALTEGTFVQWQSQFDIGAVIVKGGPAANVYTYAAGQRADAGLASPVNASGGSAELSNLTFCFDESPGDPEGPGDPEAPETEADDPLPPGPGDAVRRPIAQPVAAAPRNPGVPAPVPAAAPVTTAAPDVPALEPSALRATIRGTTRVRRGGFVVYRITVKNISEQRAYGVRFRNTPPATMRWAAVPAGATFISRTRSTRGTTKATSGRRARATMRTKAAAWSVRSLAPGASITRTVRMKMSNRARGRSCTVLIATADNARTVRPRACTRVLSASRRASVAVTG